MNAMAQVLRVGLSKTVIPGGAIVYARIIPTAAASSWFIIRVACVRRAKLVLTKCSHEKGTRSKDNPPFPTPQYPGPPYDDSIPDNYLQTF